MQLIRMAADSHDISDPLHPRAMAPTQRRARRCSSVALIVARPVEMRGKEGSGGVVYQPGFSQVSEKLSPPLSHFTRSA